MSAVAESAACVNFDTALLYAVARAKVAYPREGLRIERGLQIALASGVILLTDNTAHIASQSHPGETYPVNGHCTCRDVAAAPDGRCKHRWAKSLAKWAHTAIKAAHVDGYYATYYPPSGEWVPGVAHWTERGWCFVPDDGADPQYVAQHALCLGGRCDLVAAQATVDGDLVRRVCLEHGGMVTK